MSQWHQKRLTPPRAVITAIRAYQELRLRTVAFADANKAAIMLLDLLNRFCCILGAIVADRLSNNTVAIDRSVTDRICYAGARRAQDQEY